ncbi:MAG: helicase-associated domain-containing protein [Actinomycetes bacterium]
MTTSAPRSLADDIRGRDDAALALLLRRRPDLAAPLPADLGQVAARSLTQGSTARALERLDAFTWQVLETALVVAEPVSTESVAALLPDAPRERVSATLTALCELALLWGEPESWRVTSMVREVVGSMPAGLGPPMPALLAALPPTRLKSLLDGLGITPTLTPATLSALTDPRRVDAAVDEAPGPARDLLRRLTWGPPTGTVDRATREVDPATATTAVDWLLAHGLLVATDDRTVVLPREIAVHLRGDRLHPASEVDQPELESTAHDVARVDRTAAAAAFDAVRLLEDLLEAWALDAPTVLRAGGLGVRDLRTSATRLDVDEHTVSLLVETAHSLGLLAGDGEADEVWLPTPAYDAWRAQSIGDRWADLVGAWLQSTRVVGLVGGKDDRDNRRNALGPDLDKVVAVDVRHAVLEDLRSLAPGESATLTCLVARQRWRAPRRGVRWRDDLVGWTLREAATLGVTALGALATPARSLLDGDVESASASVGPLLPAPVDHVLLQADLTAVAPGPLDSDVARQLGLMADIESTGGATVYRFTQGSVRRALDAGRGAADLHAFVAAHSRTAVPQPLTYLIDDVARRHGRIRVGVASAYIRSDDPAVLDEVVAERRSAPLRLRRLAPTVVASQASVEIVLDRLRSMNLAPMAESPDGDVLVRRRDSRRTPPRQRPPRLVSDPPVASDAVLAAAIKALRSGERGSTASGRVVGPAGTHDLPRTAVADTITALRDAAGRRESVWIGYVGDDGTVVERVVDPVEVREGWLTAFDHRYEQIRTFAIHRVTGVASVT